MGSEDDSPRDMRRLLTQQVTDVEPYIKSVRGKRSREELKKFARQMQAGDELWEYAWAGRVGLRDCHDAGWCIVRDQQIVASHCAYSS